ncbi:MULTISPECIES: tRNA (adenosine(37)-N6)-threonylcarbamoyltransferase complex dimerization subunit type 1 TsaB [Aquimarina]|uniref:tRNA (adenosine(37)-N6)-threonylcarbamoyltransferase complex dimerization subunit type 1 TsaB n=1 Tax=Aquimarina TaxID=290174 RepID=UPI000D697231|nr:MULTISPECIES: tRNA (adenosine(37)-N6)-threonylcarbamoyltransferase complex dimerization subunit type 1 TsaB [Aquimarina]
MAYILCIETSTTNCSVALAKEREIICLEEDYNTSYSHAERLHNFINKVISRAGISLKDIAAVAVSKGPGSYTGLRIGVSAAKGLCYALDIPLIAISTLRSLALQIDSENEAYIVPMIDARRMEVYSAIFSNQNEQLRDTKAEILTEDSFKKYLDKKNVYFVGNGVEKFSAICNASNAIFVENKLPSAQEMAVLSHSKYQDKDFEDVGYFEPYYLKDFVSG